MIQIWFRLTRLKKRLLSVLPWQKCYAWLAQNFGWPMSHDTTMPSGGEFVQRTAGWEAGVSQHREGPIQDPSEILRVSRYYCTQKYPRIQGSGFPSYPENLDPLRRPIHKIPPYALARCKHLHARRSGFVCRLELIMFTISWLIWNSVRFQINGKIINTIIFWH